MMPDSHRVCIIDALDQHECWFDVGGTEVRDNITLIAHGFKPEHQTVFFRFPEESDNGRHGAWVHVDNISDKEPWLQEAIFNNTAKLAARVLRQTWDVQKHGELPKEVAVFLDAEASLSGD